MQEVYDCSAQYGSFVRFFIDFFFIENLSSLCLHQPILFHCNQRKKKLAHIEIETIVSK